MDENYLDDDHSFSSFFRMLRSVVERSVSNGTVRRARRRDLSIEGNRCLPRRKYGLDERGLVVLITLFHRFTFIRFELARIDFHHDHLRFFSSPPDIDTFKST